MLRPLTAHDAYLQGYAKCGVIRTDDGVFLIDSGDATTAAPFSAWLQEQDERVTAIYNTHAHTDHIGGNASVQRAFDCPVYAPPKECDFIRDPSLGVAFLYGGRPPSCLYRPPLFAEPSLPTPLTAACLPPDWQLLPLGGHSPETVGFITPDGTAFLSDCLCGEEILQRYPLTYIYDVAAYLQTLERVKHLRAALYLPSHANPMPDIRPLAQANIDAVWKNAEHILAICRTPQTFEELLAALLTAHGMSLTAARYALIGSTLRNYLSWLCDTEALTLTAHKSHLKWERR